MGQNQEYQDNWANNVQKGEGNIYPKKQKKKNSPKKHKIKENRQEQRHSKEKDEKKVGSIQT